MKDASLKKHKLGVIDLDRLQGVQAPLLQLEKSTISKSQLYEGESEDLFFAVNAINVILQKRLSSSDFLRALNVVIPQINQELLPDRMTLTLTCSKKKLSKGSVAKIACWVRPQDYSGVILPIITRPSGRMSNSNSSSASGEDSVVPSWDDDDQSQSTESDEAVSGVGLRVGGKIEHQRSVSAENGDLEFQDMRGIEDVGNESLTNQMTCWRTDLANRPRVPPRIDNKTESSHQTIETHPHPHPTSIEIDWPARIEVHSNMDGCRLYHDFSNVHSHDERRRIISGIMSKRASGSWLLRYNSDSHVFVITIKFERRTYHFPIKPVRYTSTNTRYTIGQNEPDHESIVVLLKYYSKHILPNGIATNLQYPVYTPAS
eukprot:CFRG6181T1